MINPIQKGLPMKQLMMALVAAGLLLSVSVAQDKTDGKAKTEAVQEAKKSDCPQECKNKECCKNMKAGKATKGEKTSEKSQPKKAQKAETKE